jgi:opacity protein-like surface antigen
MKKSFLLLVLLVALPLAAQEAPKAATTVTVAGVVGADSGDEGRRNDHEGFENGVLLGLAHTSAGLELGLRFEPTTAGWLDLTYRPTAPFRLELSLDRSRRYSDTSIRPETTPLGTPVSTLYPGTNERHPALGDDDLATTRTRLKVRAAWLPSAGVVDVTFRATDLSGERLGEAQGFAFGDGGAPAFFSPTRTDLDTREVEGALGARLRLLGVDWNGRVAFGSRTSEPVTTTPVFGTASLLELYRAAEGHDADTVRAHLTLARGWDALQLAGGVHYDKVESTPTYDANATTAAGQAVRDHLANGVSDVTRKGAAAALSVQPLSGLDVRLSGRIGREESEASGAETTRGRTYDLVQSKDLDTWSVRGELGYRTGGLRASLLGGREVTESELLLSRRLFLQEQEGERTKDSLRAELRYRAGDLKVALSGGRTWDERTADLVDLLAGYAAGPRESTFDTFSGALSGRLGKAPFTLSASWGRGETELEAPFYEPFYDPTWQLGVARAETDATSVVLHAATPGGEAFELWGEVGWRKQSWDFPGTVTFPGFTNVDEEVKGFNAALGLGWTPAEGWRTGLSGWLDSPSESVEHRAWRLEASVEKSLTKSLEALVKVRYRRFDEALYDLDDYTLTAFTFGVKGRF